MEKEKNVSLPHGREQNIKMDILGMIHSAENPFDIIYHVAKYLEKASAEAGYAENVKTNIRSVYGLALQDKKLLSDELNDVIARGQHIKEAYEKDIFSAEEKKRIEYALVLHRKNVARLKELIHKAEVDGTPPYIQKN